MGAVPGPPGVPAAPVNDFCNDQDPGPKVGTIEIRCDYHCWDEGDAWSFLSSAGGVLAWTDTGCDGPSVGPCTFPGPNAFCLTLSTVQEDVFCTGGAAGPFIGLVTLSCITESQDLTKALPGSAQYLAAEALVMDSLVPGDLFCEGTFCTTVLANAIMAISNQGAFAWFTCEESLCLRGGGHPAP